MTNDVMVRVARCAVARDGEHLIALGLGSCVAVILHDPRERIGGLVHALLPSPACARDGNPAAKFVTTGIPALLGHMESAGAVRARIDARLVGGASLFRALLASGALSVGDRNVEAARRTLAELRIPIHGSDVAGEYGRSVRFTAADGRVTVSSALCDGRIL